MKDYHGILGVRKGASKEEIQSAYRELVKKYHPDKYRNNPLSDLAEEKMKEINEAYNYLLNNPQAEYDYSYQNPYQQQNPYNNPFGNRQQDYYRGAYNRGYRNRGNDDCCQTLCTIWLCDSCCECGGCDLIECL